MAISFFFPQRRILTLFTSYTVACQVMVLHLISSDSASLQVTPPSFGESLMSVLSDGTKLYPEAATTTTMHQLRTWNVQMLSHRGHLHGVAAKINGYRERQRWRNTFDNVTFISKMCCSLNQGLAVHLGCPRTCYPGKWCFFNPVREEKQCGRQNLTKCCG